VSEQELLLQLADDELVLGWRDSEWTGIAPFLEEDVAFSSIAQNEIGHARAVYELLSEDADALAFDRDPGDYRCAPLVQRRFVPDWAHTMARRVLYEAADELRLARLKQSGDEDVAGLAAKIDREEVYHRMHAQMWRERLVGDKRFEEALRDLFPHALAVLPDDLRPELGTRFPDLPRDELPQAERGEHAEEWPALWQEMTEVRRSVPGAAW
jgi:ring-1,2-phenylacetyl-CoA epoxidase subunit PaaC